MADHRTSQFPQLSQFLIISHTYHIGSGSLKNPKTIEVVNILIPITCVGLPTTNYQSIANIFKYFISSRTKPDISIPYKRSVTIWKFPVRPKNQKLTYK